MGHGVASRGDGHPTEADRAVSARPDSSQRFVRQRMASTDKLTRAGWFAQEIAVRLGVTPRTVERYRARIRQETSR